MKCLVVDDSAVTRRILVRALEKLGATTVVEAANGKEALAVLDASFEAIITDWNMPELNGVDLVRALRDDPIFANTPMLIVTVRNAKEDVVVAADAGVDAYVLKPFTPQLIEQHLREVMERRKAKSSEGGEAKAA